MQDSLPHREMPVGVRHRKRIAELTAERLSRNRKRVGVDGNSRNRVKVCPHLRASSTQGEKEWYRGRFKYFDFNAFVSLGY